MDTYSSILAFVFGIIVGSFLNVVAFRFNTGRNVGGRSKCMSCGNTLKWFELIPILSFLSQKGSCRNCKSKISWQYPLVEFFSGIVFVLIFIFFPPVTLITSIKTFLLIVMSCLLTVITIYDIRHKIIPDSMSYSFSILALIYMFMGHDTIFHLPSTLHILAGPILSIPFAILWLVSKGSWIGLGDAKIILGLGWLLGITKGINALVLAFWIAAIVSIIWLFIKYGKFKAKVEIPFGPYIILGLYISLFFNVTIIDTNILYALIFT